MPKPRIDTQPYVKAMHREPRGNSTWCFHPDREIEERRIVDQAAAAIAMQAPGAAEFEKKAVKASAHPKNTTRRIL